MVVPMAHIIEEAHDTLYTGTPLGHITKPLVFGKRLSKLVDVHHIYAYFHEGSKERYYDIKGVWGKRKRSNVEITKRHFNKSMKRKRKSS